MGVINFKEIPEAHIAKGDQDQFELFARDFLEYLGYKIISNPNRGPDGGKDIIVQENRVGIGGETTVRWLVSCKHKAHSGLSVTPNDEKNIRDRVDSNDCNAFIGFYSTVPSSGLINLLSSSNQNFETQIFDYKKIESKLLYSQNGILICKRYFPISFKEWQVENPAPSKVFDETPSLKCENCGKELLAQNSKGIIVLWYQEKQTSNGHFLKDIEEVYWVCKGHCDHILKNTRMQKSWIDSWEDIADIMIPYNYIRWILGFLNRLKSGGNYTDQAFVKMKTFFINLFPYIARELSSKEKDRVQRLMDIPSWLGGLGE